MLDLAVFWALVEHAWVPRVVAAAIAFLLPLVIFYFLQRVPHRLCSGSDRSR